ncbi:MAG: family 43 glycosylhydrolase [Oscillospiraceae bacterium]|jgi:hypothetical protein|nr:family 43 glycosylhydrolase [Oscillospiraceae bacterium]
MKQLRKVGRALPAALLVALLAFSVFRGCGKPPQEEWTLLPFGIHYAPTAAAADRSANLLLDGDAKTFYEGGAPENGAANVLILDLGQSASKFGVARLDYTPRQDGGAAGRILKFNIYFLRSSQTGNGKQYKGTQSSLDVDFMLAGRGQFDPGSNETQSVFLHPYTGQLMAIQALPSSTNGGAISAAEIALYLAPAQTGAPDNDYGAQKEEVSAIQAVAASKNLPALRATVGAINDLVGSDTIAFNQNSKGEQQRLLAELQQLRATAENLGALQEAPNGGLWLDTQGAVIQAHGGSIYYAEAEKKYYWYGADASQPNLLATDRYQAVGVRCYSSADLLNWQPEGLALPVFNNPQLVDGSTGDNAVPLYVDESSDVYKNSHLRSFIAQASPGAAFPPNGTAKPAVPTLAAASGGEGIAKLNALYANYSFRQKQALYKAFDWEKTLRRPQVSFNPATKQYIMWLLVEDYAPRRAEDTSSRTTLVAATSATPAGPFRYAGSAALQLQEGVQYEAGDFSFFAETDGSAWLVAQLTADAAEADTGLYALRLDDEWTALATDENGLAVQKYIPGTAQSYAPVLLRSGDALYLAANRGGSPSESIYYVSQGGITGDWQEKGAFALEDAANNTYRSVGTAALPLRDADGAVIPGKFYFLADLPEPYDAQHARYALLPLRADAGKLTLRWEANALPQEFGAAAVSRLAIVLLCAGALLVALALVLALLLLRKKRRGGVPQGTPGEPSEEEEQESFAFADAPEDNPDDAPEAGEEGEE